MDKGNNGDGNVKERDDWETPQWLFNILNKQYNFTYDCCANGNNTKCKYWSENFIDDFFDDKVSWMNPPFTKAKEMFEHFFKIITKGVAIYRCDNMETKIWQEIILKNADWIFIPKGRVAYEGKDGKGSRFPSALIGIGLPEFKNIEGVFIKVKK